MGDYAGILEDGTVLPFVFERKSVGDLYGTMGKGHSRFKRELERAIACDIKICLVVEGTYTVIEKGFKYSKLRPYTLLLILGTMIERYKSHFEVVFCKDRKEMTKYILWRYFSAAKEQIKQRDKTTKLGIQNNAHS